MCSKKALEVRFVIYGCGYNGWMLYKFCEENNLQQFIYSFCDMDAASIRELSDAAVKTYDEMPNDDHLVYLISIENEQARSSVHKMLNGKIYYDTPFIDDFCEVLYRYGIEIARNKDRKKVKIKYIGFWPNFNENDFFVTKVLKQRYEIEFSDNPDYVFVSVFGKPYEYLKYEGIRILCAGEPFCPDFNLFDYAFGFEHISCLGMIRENIVERYLRYPYYMWGTIPFFGINGVSQIDAEEALDSKTRFCNFVYGHESFEGKREKLFEQINAYKHVDSAGTFLNNMGNGKTVPFTKEKINFLRDYKFTIAAETIRYPGMVTEKIIDSYRALSIPIYYGDPLLGKEFDMDSLIYWSGKDEDLPELIDKVKEIDNDKQLYLEMLSHKKTVVEGLIDEMNKTCAEFLYTIFDAPKDEACQRMKAYYSLDEEKRLKNMFVKNDSN